MRDKESEIACVCIYMAFVANEILVSVAHNDQVPRYPPAQDTLSYAKERESVCVREREIEQWIRN